MIRSLKIALTFLTVFRIPLKPAPQMVEIGRSAQAFPVVGMGMGLILAACHWLSLGHLPTVLSAVLVVSVWVVLTGGLHLDGWTDCCDALPTAFDPERRYEILKDPRLGTFGALGLMILLAVKVGALARDDVSAATLFLAPAVGRAVMVLVAYGARHGGEGMAAGVISGLDRTTVCRAAAIGLVPVLLAGWTGVMGAAAAFLGARWFRNLAEARLPAVNGDVLGAACELSETIFLLIASVR